MPGVGVFTNLLVKLACENTDHRNKFVLLAGVAPLKQEEERISICK
jgi:hypothetical protein